MFVPGEEENEHEENWEPAAEVTREVFLKWRNARRGDFPGEDMTNPVWCWLIDSNISAWRGNDHFKGPPSDEGNPGWCFNRFGRSLTELPDGTRVVIAGEHEDHYDPDFFIYNDVVIVSPDGKIEILGYPEEHFPPTDFHTATLVGNEVILIGNLGYPQQRLIGQSQVYVYDIATRCFRRIETAGEIPGWISAHEATFDGQNGIIVKGGKIDHGPDHGGYLENFDSWRLDLETWTWERLSHRSVSRWEFVRADGKACELFPMRMNRMTTKVGFTDAEFDTPEFDGELLDRLYDPLVPHEAVVEDEWSDRTHYVIDGVPLHFNEGMKSILLTVVGDLPPEVMEPYIEAVRERLTRLEGVDYKVRAS